MTYIIVCSGLFDSEGGFISQALDGFAEKYLPRYRDQEFASKESAYLWIEENHIGQERDGTTAKFKAEIKR